MFSLIDVGSLWFIVGLLVCGLFVLLFVGFVCLFVVFCLICVCLVNSVVVTL